MAAKQLLVGGVRNMGIVARQRPFVRAMSSLTADQQKMLANHRLTAEEKDLLEARFEHDYIGDEDMHTRTWRKISFLGVIPFLICFCIYKLIIVPDPHARVKFKPYEHVRIYRKPLPWRDGTGPLLFNKKMVATKDGYLEGPPVHH